MGDYPVWKSCKVKDFLDGWMGGWVEMDRFVIRTSENLILFPGPDHTNWALWLLEWCSSFSGLLPRYVTYSNTADCKRDMFLKKEGKLPVTPKILSQKTDLIWDEEQLWRIKRCPEHQSYWTWVGASSESWWWTEKFGVLKSMGSQRVGHDWAN